MIAFTRSRAERRNIIRKLPGGITKNWRVLPRLTMQRQSGRKTTNIGVRVIMPYEEQHVA